jgi:hypothetical protein
MSEITPPYLAPPKTPGEIKFMGYGNPKYTGIPDLFLDEQMQDLTEAELKVMLYIFRRTYGFKKEMDAISYDQFLHGIETREGRKLDKGAGISERSLRRALDSLTERSYIFRHQRQATDGQHLITIYELNIDGQPHFDKGGSGNLPEGVPAKVRKGSGKLPEPLSSNGSGNLPDTRKQLNKKQKESIYPLLTKNSEELEPEPEPDINTLSTQERLLRYARRNNLI